MKQGKLHLILRSLIFYRKSSVYQTVIVLILAAIITGSLLTGYSVKESLKSATREHLGNTDVLISSGLRYIDPSLAGKISNITGENCIPVLETDGYCQNFATGETASNTKIYGISRRFFSFMGNDSIMIPPGYVAINENLAKILNIRKGAEIIIHFREITTIPAGSPFASSDATAGTKVLIVSQILGSVQSGNFSLGISQIAPLNVFLNPSDLSKDDNALSKANRLLVENKKSNTLSGLRNILQQAVSPSDIGLSLRKTEATGGYEIISDRIFIDKEIVSEITGKLQSGQPVLTYLANSFTIDNKTTPYSFISAIPEGLYPGIGSGNQIVINRWLADDLGAKVNDSIGISWYSPLKSGTLEEVHNGFIIKRIVGMDSIWGDPSLMPEFPGIAGSSSCSNWDAGIPLNMKLIRKKDEAYWNSYKGTPKAFIGYGKGTELWGNNFGPATAIRFPPALSKNEIENSLTGILDPETIGFNLRDIRAESIKSASQGVDFSTLFLSLGFFIILSCMVLLALSVSVFFDSRKDQVVTLFSLGFNDKWISSLLFYETSSIAIAGAIPGVFAGGLINMFIINALNSVWTGAVQTSTLSSHIAFLPLTTGFVVTIIISMILLKVKTIRFLRSLKRSETGNYKPHSTRINFIFFLVFLITAISFIIVSSSVEKLSVPMSFTGSIMMFISLILLVRYYYTGGLSRRESRLSDRNILSELYYSFHPGQAVTPVLFIAAGIFAVFITGVNRLDINDKMKEPSGGTGGYLLWCESVVPVKENLNSASGRHEFGLDEGEIRDLSFVQGKRSPGDDASCLNLNHVTAPPLLGLDPADFIRKGSFSFASVMRNFKNDNPWEMITRPAVKNTVYGLADQTVLQWGLKMSPGDTIILKSESGQPLNIIIAAGLKSSVFQGFLIIGGNNFDEFYPSVSGSTVLLSNGDPENSEIYMKVLKERFSNYGFSVMPAEERLASFFEVTNTYLSVFTILGALGMVLGVAGLGFMLLRNYSHRKREFALMIASGYKLTVLRGMVMREQVKILIMGILTGVISAIIATLPSLKGGSEIPAGLLIIMILSIFFTGFAALSVSVKAIRNDVLITSLRKD